FRAWNCYQQQPPRSLEFGKKDSNLHHLIQSQAAYPLADSRVTVRDRGVEPRPPGWKPGIMPLDQSRIAPRGRRGSRTLKAHRSSDLESDAVTLRLALPNLMVSCIKKLPTFANHLVFLHQLSFYFEVPIAHLSSPQAPAGGVEPPNCRLNRAPPYRLATPVE